MLKRLRLIFIVIILVVLQTSCTLDNTAEYETSVGIMQNLEDLEQSELYQFTWISKDIVNNILKNHFEELLEGSRYYFLPMDDFSVINNLKNTEEIRCYDFNQEDILLGAILDASDAIPLLIPVVYIPVVQIDGNAENILEPLRLEPDESMLLRLNAAVRIASQIQSNTNSYINNYQNEHLEVDSEFFVKNFEKYVFVVKNSEDGSLTTENILAIGHCCLLTEKSDKGNQYNVIETTEIMPAHDISIVSYGSTLHVLDHATLLENERYEIEKIKASKLEGILCQKGEEDLNVPYNYTWHNQDIVKSENKKMCTWSSVIVKPKKGASYCFATKSVVTKSFFDNDLSSEEFAKLRFGKISLKASFFRKYSTETMR